MDVVHEKLATKFLRPIVALIHHHARVRVAAADRAAAGVAGVRTFVAGVMQMVGNGLDVIVNVGINYLSALTVAGDASRFFGVDGKMLAALAIVATTLNHVEEVGDDTRFNPALAVFIKIHAPRIARAFGKNFEDVLCWMIAPDTGVHPLTLFLGRAGFANVRRAENAVTAIEPAVRSPRKSVQRFV